MRTRIKDDEKVATSETAASTSGLESRIKKQGKSTESVAAAAKNSAEAGLYEVLHGRINFGYQRGEAVYADPGAIVELSAEEATRMLAKKTVRKAS